VPPRDHPIYSVLAGSFRLNFPQRRRVDRVADDLKRGGSSRPSIFSTDVDSVVEKREWHREDERQGRGGALHR
jgi:hypothetical protein